MINSNVTHLRSLPSIFLTYERYMYLLRQLRKYSLTRALQYEILNNYPLKGNVLDFGGGENSLYRDIIKCDDYQSINIDQNINPTWLIGVNEKIPCEDESFDTVISLNTLEHIFDAKSVVSDLCRVLKSGGELILTVPFLFPIHGHPDDFFRPTSSWYVSILHELGFKEVDVRPLSWGPFSTAATCSGLPGPAKLFRKKCALTLDFIYHKLSLKRSSEADVFQQLEKIATGFFVRAIK